MPPENSDTAQQPPVTDAPVTPPVETPPEVPVNANELETELSEEDEKNFVDQILKDGNYEPPVAPKEDTPEPPAVEPPVVTPPVVEPPKEEVKEEPPVELTEPQTDDLWIEVEKVVTDDLGEETTEMVKLIYDPNDPSSFIPDDFQAKTTKQLADIMDAKAEMANLYAGRRAEFDTATELKSNDAKQQAILDGWDVEVKDLVSAGAIPDPEKAKEEFEAKTDAVYLFMAAQNKERSEKNLPTISSFGTALTMYENSEAVKAAAEAEKKDDEEAKLKGGMVGGGSAAAGGSPETPAYKSGSHKNIWDVEVPE